MEKKILFYSSVSDKKLFEIQRFYKIDIQLLEEIGFDVILSNKIWEAFLFWRYDIAFIYFYKYGFFVALIAKLLFKKIFFTGGIDNLDKGYASKKNYCIQKIFFKLCNLLSNSSLVVSYADLMNIKQIYGGEIPKNISFSEHTIDIDSFSMKIPKIHQFVTIAWMGNEDNVRRKGVDKALYLFKFLISKPEFSDYKFIIIGKQGEGSVLLTKLADQLLIKDKIIFKGNISEQEKIEILSQSKYYMQLSQYEGFGIAALEALASNDIVIHSAKGGLKYSMEDFGIVYDIDQPMSVENENLYTKLTQFDIKSLEKAYVSINKRFSNIRRKEDFVKIIKS